MKKISFKVIIGGNKFDTYVFYAVGWKQPFWISFFQRGLQLRFHDILAQLLLFLKIDLYIFYKQFKWDSNPSSAKWDFFESNNCFQLKDTNEKKFSWVFRENNPHGNREIKEKPPEVLCRSFPMDDRTPQIFEPKYISEILK